jgi:hypothetical protein
LDEFIAGEPKLVWAVACFKLERNDPDTHQVLAMNALEALGQDRSNTDQRRSLRRPIP